MQTSQIVEEQNAIKKVSDLSVECSNSIECSRGRGVRVPSVSTPPDAVC